MNSRFASVLLIASTLLFGNALAASTEKNRTVRLDRDALVGGVVLPAGTYRLDVATGLETAKFLQGKRVVAEAPCKLRLAEAVYPGTAVHYRKGDHAQEALVKIVFADSSLAVEFNAGSGETADAAGASPAGQR
jgi:hypothetical protein